MVKQINAIGTIDLETEIHYAILSTLDPNEYPQVHDFFELFIVVDGIMELTVNDHFLELSANMMYLIRPGDIHSKKNREECHHINLAFPPQVMDKLFEYLCSYQKKADLINSKLLPIFYLTLEESIDLKSKLESLQLLSYDKKDVIRTNLRFLIIQIISRFFVFNDLDSLNVIDTHDKGLPQWFTEFLCNLNKKEVFTLEMKDILSITDKTQEHICRMFQKHFLMTPSRYINKIRLNYAANLLTHTDQSIIDICFNCGFQNLSYFYHQFKSLFGRSPNQFRNQSRCY